MAVAFDSVSSKFLAAGSAEQREKRDIVNDLSAHGAVLVHFDPLSPFSRHIDGFQQAHVAQAHLGRGQDLHPVADRLAEMVDLAHELLLARLRGHRGLLSLGSA